MWVFFANLSFKWPYGLNTLPYPLNHMLCTRKQVQQLNNFQGTKYTAMYVD